MARPRAAGWLSDRHRVKTRLRHNDPFQLLVATILSAQCTDKQVNSVMPGLFSVLKGPRDVAEAPIELLEKLIRPTGFFHNKAKHLKACSRALIERHEGKVPSDIDALVQLPGVGRKTANVVLGAAFGIPAVVVDTHVARLSNRLGLSQSKSPAKIETDLAGLIPKEAWNDFSLQLIYHGRAVCKARNPECPVCPLKPWCDFGRRNGSVHEAS